MFVSPNKTKKKLLKFKSMESLDISNGQPKSRTNRYGTSIHKSYGLEQIPGVVPTIAAEASR